MNVDLDYKLMGKRLKSARIKKGYTQEKLSEIIDMSTPYLSKIENGKVKINLRRLHQICLELGVSEGYILNGVYNDSEEYLNPELNSLLQDCSSENKNLLYKFAEMLSEEQKNKRK